MTAGSLAYFFGALVLSLGCSTLATRIADALDSEIEGRFGVALAACFIPPTMLLLAHGAFGFTDALPMLASMLAAGFVCWSFRRQLFLTGMKRPRAS